MGKELRDGGVSFVLREIVYELWTALRRFVLFCKESVSQSDSASH